MDKSSERLNMLQRNNQQLSAELARVREENQRLDKSVNELRGKQTEYTDTVAAVDRVWRQLNDDMAYLTRRIKGFSPPLKGVKDEPQLDQDAKLDSRQGFEHADPFLRRLITVDHADVDALKVKLEEIADDATDVEKALAPKMNATLQAFSALVDLYDKDLVAQRAAVEEACKGSNFQAEIIRLQKETDNLRLEVDAQKAVSRTAEAQLAQLTDMLKKDETLLQELNNELADKREEVSAVNRKLHTLRSMDGSSSLASQGSLPLPTASSLPAKASVSPAPKAGEIDASDEVRLAQKEVKLEKERAESLARQLRDAQTKLQDESFIHQTAAFQIVQRQLQTQVAELEKARRLLEAAQREIDSYKHSMQGLMQQAEDAKHQRRMLNLTEERLKELENQLSNARSAQEAAELALQEERQKQGNQKTVKELQDMLQMLEKEAKASQSKAAKQQSLAAETEAARRETRSAISSLEAKEAEAKSLRHKLEKCQAELIILSSQEKDLKGVADDLRVFVEVLNTFCDDPRDLAEVRSKEASLQNQLSALQKQLKGHELQAALDEAKAAETEAESQVAALEQHKSSLELENADLKRQCRDLQQQVASLSSDIEAFNAEMETVGSAFEEMQGKNSALLTQLAERDELSNKLLTEKLQAQHTVTRLTEQRAGAETARRTAEQQAAAARERITALETRLQESMVELGQAREKATAVAQQAEKLSIEVREREAHIQQRDMLLSTSHGIADQRKRQLDEEGEKLHRERSKRQRLEEEQKVLQGKLEKLGMAPDSATNEQLEGMRLLTRCRVCHVRPKDTVITKCWHTFCRDCVGRIIETRNRKCPACGLGFGATDVKQIYL